MKKLILILFAMVGLSICGKAQDNDSFTNMNVESFANYITNDSVQLLDVRMVEEFDDGHLVGAENIDFFDLDFIVRAQETLDKSRPVAVYCRSGKRSANAAQKLSEQGYNVINLEGGIMEWIKENKPIAR
ncbi:MAG: rhodanese-like domain-containing protein [Bacteroides sp.]|nr:rhodanese-like domain-containing protein [Bacteroides sp.]